MQTKSFWIGLVAILCLFMLSVIWMNSYYWYKICSTAIETNKVVYDIGHFESEVHSKEFLKELCDIGTKGVIADEESPFN